MGIRECTVEDVERVMINQKRLQEFYLNKKVLVTGHTGFKGAWLCKVLDELGADVIGYSLDPPTNPSLYEMIRMNDSMQSYIGDIRDIKALKRTFDECLPEIVIHMAAQPIVRESYKHPVETYETNVMGTVNVLECVRTSESVKSLINVTTDKVYRNDECDRGYIESDYLDGYDPYSNSKSCSELVTHSYIQSFLYQKGIAVSTCRAGNVIGGGDYALDRIIPDCIRAAFSKQKIAVRNPYSIRPYQHVLEPLIIYLTIAMEQYEDNQYAGSYNVGPDDNNCVTTGELVDVFCNSWNRIVKEDRIEWVNQSDGGPHEAHFLKLDCTKLKETFQWKPKWSINEAIDRVVEFAKVERDCHVTGNDSDIHERLGKCMKDQINQYLQEE